MAIVYSIYSSATPTTTEVLKQPLIFTVIYITENTGLSINSHLLSLQIIKEQLQQPRAPGSKLSEKLSLNMKIVFLLFLAVLATLAWAKPSYLPAEVADRNPWDVYYPSMPSNEVSDVRMLPTLLIHTYSLL